MRNSVSITNFPGEKRWHLRSGGPGPAEYGQGDSVFKKASMTRLYPIFSMAETEHRAPHPKFQKHKVQRPKRRFKSIDFNF